MNGHGWNAPHPHILYDAYIVHSLLYAAAKQFGES